MRRRYLTNSRTQASWLHCLNLQNPKNLNYNVAKCSASKLSNTEQSPFMLPVT